MRACATDPVVPTGKDRVTRRLRWLFALPLVLVAVVALGPHVRPHPLPPFAPLPVVPREPAALQAWVDARERTVTDIRPDNQARIVWADPLRPSRTACAIVYLHGFGASQGEGAPTHQRLAKAFGCNLYLARLPGHGRRAMDAMRGIDASAMLLSATEALAIGHALGDKVIVIGTSMGGALALELGATQPKAVDALVLWSPLVRERANALAPMTWPWGPVYLKYAKNHGSDVLHHPGDSSYWAEDTHLDGYTMLADLTRGQLVPSTFARVTAPVFMAYYYRDEAHQDPTVSVAAMLAMYQQLGTPAALKRKQDFPDADAHVIASPLRSRATEGVYAASYRFLQDVVGLTPAEDGQAILH